MPGLVPGIGILGCVPQHVDGRTKPGDDVPGLAFPDRVKSI
jgi:hypothetical protein